MTERGLRRGNWSVQELERLRALLPRRGVKGTATLLRRSAASVYRKAMEIMRVGPRRGAWSEADEALLRDAWGVIDVRLLGAILGRTVLQINSRVAAMRQELRSGSWASAEQFRLKEFYGTRADADLEISMGRPREEVERMARDLCLAKDKRFAAVARRRGDAAVACSMPRWSPAEVELLRSLYSAQDNLEVARRLGRTVASVANKANQLGLRKSHDVLASIGRANVRARHHRGEGASGP